MFKKRPASIKDRLLDVGGELVDTSRSSAEKFNSAKPNKVDAAAAGALLLGMGNWVSMSLFNFDAVKAVAGRKSMSGRTAYGLLGLSALYATVRGARRVKS